MNKIKKKKCEQLLSEAGLRKTRPRIDVLSVLVRSTKPQTQEQIAGKLEDGPDKVTIYRTLETFLEAGIIHRAYLQERSWHYELGNKCTERQCHPHFTCNNCGKISCMPELKFPLAKEIHKGFHITHQQVRLEGLCPECTRK